MALNPNTITGQIYLTIFKLLEEQPKGIQWTELNRQIQARHPDFHPKTINGCVWKLIEKFPERVHKPEKGLFQLIQVGQ